VYIVKNDEKNRASLVSKSLPIKNFILVIYSFTAGNDKYCALFCATYNKNLVGCKLVSGLMLVFEEVGVSKGHPFFMYKTFI